MIFYNNKKLKAQIEANYKELENYKNSYSKRISLYNTYLDTMQVFEDGVIDKNNLNKEEMENKIQVFQTQIDVINSNLEILNNLLEDIDYNDKIGKKKIKNLKQNYKEIRNNYIANSIFEEQVTESYINGLMCDLAKTLEKNKEEHEKEMEKVLNENTSILYLLENENANSYEEPKMNTAEEKEESDIQLKNNNTLLIFEKQGKVVLPYRAEEVISIFEQENNKYNSIDDVINDRFTRDFANYKIQFASRYRETMKLAREREKYSFIDAVTLALEMMKKRFLHPAIISACRTLNELDVYLDCLDKNELEDFKIFKIKYELYPVLAKPRNSKNRIIKDFS